MTEYIQACVSNVDNEAQSLLTDADTSSSVYPCLEQCGCCYREPFLVVDSKRVTGDSHAALLKDVDG